MVVWYKLSQMYDRQIGRLRQSLASEGIFCAPCAEGRLPDSPDALLLTDDRELAGRAGAAGIACIGIGSLEDPFFAGTELVTDSPDLLSRAQLELYLSHAHGIPAVIARTERLLLREMIPEDFDALLEISRENGLRYVRRDEAGESCFSRERLETYIRSQYRFYGYGLWSVLLRGQPKTLIGCCGFAEAEPGADADRTKEQGQSEDSRKQAEEQRNPEDSRKRIELELEFMLGKEWRGKGYGTEMCRAALAYASEQLEAERIWVRIHPDNPGAVAFARTLGFVRCAGSRDGLVWLSLFSSSTVAIHGSLKHLLFEA